VIGHTHIGMYGYSYFTVSLFYWLQYGHNILHLAVKYGSTELLKWIIAQSLVSVDTTDEVSTVP